MIVECVDMLIQGNADAHAVDEEGNTALHLACSGVNV